MKTKTKSKNWMMMGLIILSLLRIGLNMKLPITAYASERFDDALLFEYANSLLGGNWLGTYNELTLTKGLTYPFFLVFCHKFFIPYMAGLALLKILSSAIFVKAISKKVFNKTVRAVIYLLLLFSPDGFTFLISQRTYRMALVPDFVILVFACLIGLLFRKDEKKSILCLWASGAGISFALFWYVREDSIWIVPFVAVWLILFVLYEIKTYYKNIKEMLLRIVPALFPIVFLIIMTVGISAVNAKHYGQFTTNDRSGTAFAEVMNDLYIIEDTNAPDHIWVSWNAIESAFKASPTFAEAKEPILSSYAAWAGGDEKNGVAGDLTAWVLRDALRNYGCYTDAKTANEYCTRVHQELTKAFEDGSLKRDSKLHLLASAEGTSVKEIGQVTRRSIGKLLEMARYKECGVTSGAYGFGDTHKVREIESLTSAHTVYQIENQPDPLPTYTQRAVKGSNLIVKIYQCLSLLTMIVVPLAYLYMTVYVCAGLFKHKYDQLEWWLAITGILLSAFALMFGVQFFGRWFGSDMEQYFSFYACGVYPLLQIAKYMTIFGGIACAYFNSQKKIVQNSNKI